MNSQQYSFHVLLRSLPVPFCFQISRRSPGKAGSSPFFVIRGAILAVNQSHGDWPPHTFKNGALHSICTQDLATRPLRMRTVSMPRSSSSPCTRASARQAPPCDQTLQLGSFLVRTQGPRRPTRSLDTVSNISAPVLYDHDASLTASEPPLAVLLERGSNTPDPAFLLGPRVSPLRPILGPAIATKNGIYHSHKPCDLWPPTRRCQRWSANRAPSSQALQ